MSKINGNSMDESNPIRQFLPTAMQNFAELLPTTHFMRMIRVVILKRANACRAPLLNDENTIDFIGIVIT